MKKILHLISSPRKDASYSIKLGRAIVAKLSERHPDAVLEEVDLTSETVPHLNASHLQAFVTPAGELTTADKAAIQKSDKWISQLMESDFIVIGAPLYNFTIHSALKAWFDHIVRAGKTFSYSEKGPEGFVKNKKVYLAVSSGGVYSEGAMQSYDFVAPYLQTILGFIGMTDVKVFRAEGVNIPGIKEEALNKAIESIEL